MSNKATMYYCDIGDYLSRDEKLAIIKEMKSVDNPAMNWQVFAPVKFRNDILNPELKPYSTLNSYPCSFSHSIDRGRAYFMLVSALRESWKVMMEPLRTYFLTISNTCSLVTRLL